MIINLLNKLSFNFKNNYNNYVYDSKLISVKFLSILLNIKKRLIINDYIFIDMLNIKHMRKI